MILRLSTLGDAFEKSDHCRINIFSGFEITGKYATSKSALLPHSSTSKCARTDSCSSVVEQMGW